MKYNNEGCSLCDCLNAFLSRSHSPAAVVIYVNEEKAGEEFFEDLKFFEVLGELSIHGDNVGWISSAFDNLQGFIMNYGDSAKTYFKEGKCVVFSLNPGFDVFNNGPKKAYLIEALQRWGANGILEIIVEAEQTILTTVV